MILSSIERMQWADRHARPPCWRTTYPHDLFELRVLSSMVNFCAVVGCSNRSSRESSKKFFRLPAVVSHQGKETRVLSEKRRADWLSGLCQADLKESQYPSILICSDHFVKGQPASLYEKDDPDWAASLRLGHAGVKERTSAQKRHSRSLERS